MPKTAKKTFANTVEARLKAMMEELRREFQVGDREILDEVTALARQLSPRRFEGRR